MAARVPSGKQAASSGGVEPRGAPAEATSGQRLTGLALGLDGTIYAAGLDGLYAVSPEGKLLWKFTDLGAVTAPPAIGPDGTIYLAASSGTFASLNANGTVQWNPGFRLIGFDGSPAISNGTMYLANTFSDLWAFEPGHTTENWHILTEREGMGGPTLPGAFAFANMRKKSSFVIGSLSELYVPRMNWLHNIRADGTPGWSTLLTKGMLGPAAIGQNGTIYVGSLGGSKPELFAVSPSGAPRWKLQLPSQIEGSPVVGSNGNIFASTTTRVVNVSADGSIAWQFDPQERCTSGPALAEDGTLYLGLDMGKFIAVSAEGKLKWTLRTRGTILGAPVIAPDGTIYVVTDVGEIVALQDAGSPMMRNAWARYQHDSQNTGKMSGQ